MLTDWLTEGRRCLSVLSWTLGSLFTLVPKLAWWLAGKAICTTQVSAAGPDGQTPSQPILAHLVYGQPAPSSTHPLETQLDYISTLQLKH
jgi:hypothetical protein